jgi:UDP-N-acetylmuramate--alanine ligase
MNGTILEVEQRHGLIMKDQETGLDLPKIAPGTAIHFTGIGGIGMSGLARICLERGARVTGADKRENDQIRALVDAGAIIHIGEHPELVEGCDMMVYSSAVAHNHPERQQARSLNIPSIRRGTLLAVLAEGYRLLGVAGTHGKTTTTSMLALAVRGAGLDPTIVVGGDLPNIGGNAYMGLDPYCVAETDESDGSFLELSPYLALVTNVEDDHLEHYGDIFALQDAFRDFIGAVENPTRRILCADCGHLYSLARRSFGQDFTSYGFSEVCDVRGAEIHFERTGSSCVVLREGEPIGQITLQVPGVHMLSNAIGAFTAGLSLGLSADALSKGLAEYHGTRRRFEVLGKWQGATLIDDYGHHPTEIRATLRALRQFTAGRTVVVFQPHRYSRTDQLFDEFGDAFGGTDLLILTEIYSAGEEPRPGVTSRHLLSRISGVGTVVYAPTLEDVTHTLKKQIQEGDAVVFLGAGDVNQVAYRLLERGE